MSLEAHVRITNPTGLHARPAVKLAQLAASFDADVHVRVGEGSDWVRARSTAKVMKLKAGANSTLHFRAEGEQASDALNALLAFVARDFDEEVTPGVDAREGVGSTAHAISAPDEGPDRAVGGEVASRGLAAGRLWVLVDDGRASRVAGDPTSERAAFGAALARAITQLEGLTNGTDAAAAEVIAFQVGLLRDEEFVSPVAESIGEGSPADQAWDLHLSREIADYESAEDTYFRDRAADLRDLHDRVARALAGANGELGEVADGAIVVTDELTPSRFLELDWKRLAGAATREGSIASHVAMLARSRGVPFIVKLSRSPADLRSGTEAIVDAERGFLLLEPSPATRGRYERLVGVRRARAREDGRFLDKPARTAAGVAVRTFVNVDDPAALRELDPAHCDGIGLTRTEFLFQRRAGLPGEDLQYGVYRRLVEWAGGRPVTIRTLDAGGDKPVPGLTVEGERNPFLGMRGVRLTLAHPEVFRVQLRALARAAAHGPVKAMLPMVTVPSELEQARAMLDEEVAHLGAAGIAAARPALGMMVEVPAAALGIDRFAADFFSIGSNDLVQYVTASSRDSAELGALLDPLNPAVLELIARVAAHGERAGIEVSVCGEMASVPECLPALLEAGIRALSVPPARLAAVKAAIAGL